LKQRSDISLADARLIFLDLQTTGASPQHGHVLEMAWSLGAAAQEQPSGNASYLIRQPADEPVPGRITALTGITAEDMECAVELSFARTHLLEHLAQSDSPNSLLIHFAQFEKSFLHQEVLPEEFDRLRLLCTHQIAARLFPNLPSRGIRGLAGYFGLSMEDCKRAASNVHATFLIWRNLCAKLAELGVTTIDEMELWLSETPTAKRTKYEYPIGKEIRLAIPDNPGIYRMLSSTGKILYVGKATSLKSRVNSYFRGQRGRDSRKLEMLTQAWDIRYTVCDTVVEACVMEVEEIKTLSPPYNVSLKTPDRQLVFYSPKFDSITSGADEEHPFGPFRSEIVMDPFVRLCWSLANAEFDPLMFFDPVEESLLIEGWSIFLTRHVLEGKCWTFEPRTLLALGLWLRRRYALAAEEEALMMQSATEQDSSHPNPSEQDSSEPESSQETPSDETEIELNGQDVAEKYERLLMRAAGAYRLSKTLTRLLNSEVTFEEDSKLHQVQIVASKLNWKQTAAIKQQTVPAHSTNIPHMQWLGLTSSDFDRLRVLHTELCRIRNDGLLVRVLPTAIEMPAAIEMHAAFG
jgi:DNA polymerase III subunit epsilon